MQSTKGECTSDGPAWRQWCRLCAKEDSGNANIYCKNEIAGMDSSLATAIGKYFWVNIRQTDELPQCLCLECKALLTSLVAFTERVNKVQALFSVLQNTASSDCVDLSRIRARYGVFDEELVHIFSSMQAPVIPKDSPVMRGRRSKQGKQQNEQEKPDPEKFEIETHWHEELSPKSEEDTADPVRTSIDEDDVFIFADDNATELKRIKRSKYSANPAGSKQKEELCDMLEIIADEYIPHSDNSENGYDNSESISVGELDAEQETLDQPDDSIEADEELASEAEYSESDDGEEYVDYTFKNDLDYDDRPEQDSVIKEVTCIESVKRKRGRPRKSEAPTSSPAAAAACDSLPKLKRVTSDCRYECRLCQRRYKNATSYRKHMNEQHNTAPDIPDFKCEECAEIFPTERQLAAHKRRHLPLAEKLDVPCPYCEKKFTKLTVMRQHVAGVHRNEKPYVCDQCGRTLKTLAALNEHKLVHTNECPWECEVCHKCFKNKARLKVHLDTHNETGYVCNQCGLKLNTRRTLKMHMRVHEDSMPYTCDFCGIRFKRGKALKNHLILHTGLKPYKCNFCERTFSNGSNCRAHKKKAHPEELALEEAEGKKPQRTLVPKLEELRASQNLVHRPRRANRPRGGLPNHHRALLIAAEKRKREMSGRAVDGIVGDGDDFAVDDPDAQTIHNFDDYNGGDVVIEERERGALDDYAHDGEDDDDDDDDDAEETVIYEIIDEI